MPPKRQAASVSEKIRETIEARKLSAAAVAIEARINSSVVSRFLARERGMTSDSLDAVAEALGLRLVEGRGGLGT
jgi:transcriptional regulator with XRE-family HTH domain